MNAYIKYVNKAIKKQSRKKQNKSCDKFCKKDYMVQMDSVFRKSAKKYKIPYNPTKIDKQFSFNVCRKTFCNPKCNGYLTQQKRINKTVRNGFQKEYNLEKINTLKNKGALSACVDIVDYKL